MEVLHFVTRIQTFWQAIEKRICYLKTKFEVILTSGRCLIKYGNLSILIIKKINCYHSEYYHRVNHLTLKSKISSLACIKWKIPKRRKYSLWKRQYYKNEDFLFKLSFPRVDSNFIYIYNSPYICVILETNVLLDHFSLH